MGRSAYLGESGGPTSAALESIRAGRGAAPGPRRPRPYNWGVERKLATVLFVDLVDSTGLVSASDPEVVRRRVTRFFDHVSRCIESHGGTVEKFAGDSVMAAFGIPQAHEDDAERALRAALGILDSVRDLGLPARIGVEAGEVVADSAESTFATGEAVNIAARLQQTAAPGEILVGPSAFRLAMAAIEFEPAGPRELRGRPEPVMVWRAVSARDGGRQLSSLSAPLVGRDAELELLENTYERAVRHRRAHLFTIYGEPGVGKSRLAREFVSGLEGATVLAGRCLPYGEGITYWPLAEMVKSAAGISDDDPAEEAHEKLLVCCEDEEVADLLGLAAGVLEAVERQRNQQEIAWAAREWAEQLAAAQPLVLVFEDIHWAEEPLLELVEHLSSWVRDAPLLILCLARAELLDVHPGWGGGRVRATAIELEALPRAESEELVDALLVGTQLSAEIRSDLLEKTEGNPLFVEETIRMVAEQDGDGRVRIPDTLQALIAARIDRLPPAEKLLLQRASIIGRVFWGGALARLAPDLEDVYEVVDDLLLRDFILRESRSTISGERAYRFKHVLIREVAYAGVSKSDRAEHHRVFAEWLGERAGEELLEIRAYHLDQAATLVAELDGAAPRELATEAADALAAAGKRALARESNRAARRLLLRATELEPTLERRYKAAVAAWRLDDLPALAAEMEEVAKAAAEAGDDLIHGRALTALAHVALLREADLALAQERAERALAVLPDDDYAGRFDALSMRAQMAWWVGDLDEDERYARAALEIARRAERKDLESEASHKLATIYMSRLELDEAEPLVKRACELADQSGSISTRGSALSAHGRLLVLRGELDQAEALLEEARALFEEAGSGWPLAGTLNSLAWIAAMRKDTPRAERLFRESIRILKPLEDRGTLCESQRGLAQVLVSLGRLEEAERVALEARKTVGPNDQSSRATTRVALAIVRLAQGRDAEAEELTREALSILTGTGFLASRVEVLNALVGFLSSRGRLEEAAQYEAELAELVPVEPIQAAGIA
jgi:class 3 adenylate cyclase/tetratricopeptide (TPR) repeat protein